MHSVEISIKTLTPLYTGGISGQMDHIHETSIIRSPIHETSIIGSLRWWYEAIVRGLGGQACDPADTENRCSFNLKDYEKSKEKNKRDRLLKAGLCDVCQIFGATGWKRRFQLEIGEVRGKLTWNDIKPLNIKPHDRNRGWFLPAGWTGEFSLFLRGDKDSISKLVSLICFLEKWGALGSKHQLGYGVFCIEKIKGDFESFSWEEIGKEEIKDLPDFRTFTFFKLLFKPEGKWWGKLAGFSENRNRKDMWKKLLSLSDIDTIPVTPLIRNSLRYRTKWSSYRLQEWLFGFMKGKENIQKSKFFVSWAYVNQKKKKWEIRGWIYLPQDDYGKRFYYEITKEFEKKFRSAFNWFNLFDLKEKPQGKVSLFPEDFTWKKRACSDVMNSLKFLTGED